MKFKNGSKVVCKNRFLLGSATEEGPRLNSAMRRWAANQEVLTVAEQGVNHETRVRLVLDGADVYGFWFECEDLRPASPISLENK